MLYIRNFTVYGKVTEIENANEELKEVSKGLGYKEKEFKNILGQIDTSKSIEQQLKDALKLLLK